MTTTRTKANPPHPLALLRPRRKRPCGRTADLRRCMCLPSEHAAFNG